MEKKNVSFYKCLLYAFEWTQANHIICLWQSYHISFALSNKEQKSKQADMQAGVYNSTIHLCLKITRKVFLSESLAISIHSAIFQKQKIDKWQIIWLGRLFLCCFCTAQNEKNDCHTLGTTSALVSVLAEESSSTNSTYANPPSFSQATKIHPTLIWSEFRTPASWSQLSRDFLQFNLPQKTH